MKPKLLLPVSASLLAIAIAMVCVCEYRNNKGNKIKKENGFVRTPDTETSTTDYIFFHAVNKHLELPFIK